MTDTTCIECGGEIEFTADPVLGELIDCMTCGSELEVTDLDPVVLRPAPELAEDWGE